MTLDEVKTATLADIARAKADPDYWHDENAAARILCERMWNLPDRMSPESQAFVDSLKARRWVTQAALYKAIHGARLDFEADRDCGLDPRFFRSGVER